MYDTTREILPQLDGAIMLLPTHGAGTSCGKGLSKQNLATLENQRQYNPMLETMSKEDFVAELTSDQPSIPAYFTNSVLLNKKGNTPYNQAQQNIPILNEIPHNITVIDTRSSEMTRTYPLTKHAINIDSSNPGFVGLLGTIIKPDEPYIIIIEKAQQKGAVVHDVLSIGYEKDLSGIFCVETSLTKKETIIQEEVEKSENILYLDVRSRATSQENPLTKNTQKVINIPLEELANNIDALDKKMTYVPYC
jgi:hypothetical protein